MWHMYACVCYVIFDFIAYILKLYLYLLPTIQYLLVASRIRKHFCFCSLLLSHLFLYLLKTIKLFLASHSAPLHAACCVPGRSQPSLPSLPISVCLCRTGDRVSVFLQITRMSCYCSFCRRFYLFAMKNI